jgi:hypothetical protein
MPRTNLAENQLALGTIVSSMLTLAQYQSLHGTGWVLADGTSCAGTSYATVSGATLLPDPRGQALRGKNNGRADGLQDPAGERTIGSQQTHATAKNGLFDSGHLHNTAMGAAGNNGYGLSARNDLILNASGFTVVQNTASGGNNGNVYSVGVQNAAASLSSTDAEYSYE